MTFGPSRGHFIGIFEHFFKDFGLAIVGLLFALVSDNLSIADNIPIFVILLIQPFFRLYSFFTTKYTIDEEKIIIQKGLIQRKVIEIPNKVITTVDFSQSILFQVFGIYRLLIDNASQTNDTANKAELSLCLKKQDAQLVKSIIMKVTKEQEIAQRMNQDTEQTNELKNPNNINTRSKVTVSIKDFILVSLFQSKIGVGIYLISLISGLVLVIGQLANVSDDNIINRIESIMTNITSNIPLLIGILLIAIIPYYVVTTAYSIVQNVISYYQFTVTNRQESLHISYGLFTKKSYTLMKDKISGLCFRQSFLMRLFGYGVLEVYVIGYGDMSEDNKKELSMLFPILKKQNLESFVSTLLPEIKLPLNQQVKKAEKSSFRYFFYCPTFIFALSLLVASFFSPYRFVFIVTIPLFILAIISVYLQYRHTFYFADQETIWIQSGGFQTQQKFIKTTKMEFVTEQSFFLKRKRGYTNILLGYNAPLRVSKQHIKNMTFHDVEGIKNILDY